MADPRKALQDAPRPAIPVRSTHPWPSPVAPMTTQQFAPELLDVASRPGAPAAPLAWDTRSPTWLQRGGPSEQRARVASQEGVVTPSAVQLDDIKDIPHLAMSPVKMLKGGGMAAVGVGALARRLAQMEERQAAEEALKNMPDYMAHRAPHAVPPGAPLPPMPRPGYPATAQGWKAWQRAGGGDAGYQAVIDQWERDQRIQKWLGGEGGAATAGPPRVRMDLPSAEMTPESIAPLPPMAPTPVPSTPAGPVPTTNPGRRKRTP